MLQRSQQAISVDLQAILSSALDQALSQNEAVRFVLQALIFAKTLLFDGTICMPCASLV